MEWQLFLRGCQHGSGGTSETWLLVTLSEGALTAKTNQKVDEIQVSETLEKGHPLLSSIWLSKKKDYLPKRIPFIMQPTTSNVFRVQIPMSPCQSSSKPDAAFLTLDWDMVWERHGAQWAGTLEASNTAAFWITSGLLSTDSLPTLIVAVRIKRAVSQLQCL